MKNHHHDKLPHPTKRNEIHEAIATRAYELWVEAGRPENQSVACWLEAEQELMTGRRTPGDMPALLPVSF